MYSCCNSDNYAPPRLSLSLSVCVCVSVCAQADLQATSNYCKHHVSPVSIYGVPLKNTTRRKPQPSETAERFCINLFSRHLARSLLLNVQFVLLFHVALCTKYGN